jgi:hypothetical protein
VLEHQGNVVFGEPGAVFNAVDAGVDKAGQSIFAEDVRGDPGPVGVCGVDRGFEYVVGPQRGEIAGAAIDPVTDQFDPAVAAPRLLGHRCRQLRFVVQFDCEALLVALGSGQMLSGPDDAG